MDFRGVGAPYAGRGCTPSIPERGVQVDNWGIHRRWVEHESGGYWDYCDFPLQDADEETVATLADALAGRLRLQRTSPSSAGSMTEYRASTRRRRPGRHHQHGNGMLRGMEQVLVDLITDDPAGLLLIDRRMDIQLEITAARWRRPRAASISCGWARTWARRSRPLISLELFRKHIRPRHQQFIDLARAYNLPVMIHTCGSSSWAYEDFIEMGIDAVDTLQPEAKNMAPAYLKKTLRRPAGLPRLHHHRRPGGLRHGGGGGCRTAGGRWRS